MPAMKRKLDERDRPQPSSPPKPADTPIPSFASFELEPRLLRGVRDQRWNEPSKPQAEAIPLAIQGKDIILRAGTGTGKTAAYLLPILNTIVRRPRESSPTTTALILVPTKELAQQVTKLARDLSAHCGQSVRTQNLAGKESDVVARAKLAELPDIVVATPARASAHINKGALSLDGLGHLVIDEADLVMGYGFKEDLEAISKSIPKGVQIFLMSATLSTDVEALRPLFRLTEPVVLDLGDLEKDSQQVKQYVIRCAEDEKFLLVYALFMLKLIRGKSIIFVGDVDRSYRVSLFLGQIGIKSCVLNSELPLASRLRMVEEFNKNVYNILIASDEAEVVGSRTKANDDESRPKKKAKSNKTESGVSRGIDFIDVSSIINFDLPSNYKSYFHRIGRTARAGKTGTAISFVIPADKFRKHKPTSFAGSKDDEDVLAKIEQKMEGGQKMENYGFDMKKLEPFRYRFQDALRAVTRIAVREARLKELRTELVNSSKLSRYFEENPEALSHLRHDLNLNHPTRIQPHLAHVPSYLLPGGKKAVEDMGFVGLEKEKKGRAVYRKGKKVVRNKAGKIDPLKTFNMRGRGKK
ncbi:P-loop containing nucleoside triphosphate hydrolase protein [Massariosphaeria phaeospora]|uniref:RNA helicase n=1 Tax=Massariosphaeria phaeospora TaxID=100035 RepID=A0A7C8MAI2_9PLEO|nr:P-loop containing nucleoside triphosphate hydrolase protein [Massariosphaeria phaeospora]